ncbi:phage repressor protein CI [Serratia quinivorans]|uniref:phage repressor protein CI n=1 Tax=Serratia quinivorans TaxID=137545 RepID=UPI00217936C9|nr:phage repressor protein CI [Serratia quinivorans]CAI0922887.1 Bacteriophage CI repressor helix-turn-helix domain [Serratia quinivorans]
MMQIDFTKGGSEVLDRVLEAYGFKMKVQLADHLGIASSSMAMRYKRDIFPADIVVRCMLETGVTLEWITTGKGKKFESGETSALNITRQKLVNRQLHDFGSILFDAGMFLDNHNQPTIPMCIVDDRTQYIIDKSFSEVNDGLWLVEIEGKVGIRTLTRIPVKKVRVSGHGAAFDCDIDDITVLGRIVLTVE